MHEKPYIPVWNPSIERIDRQQWNHLAIPLQNPFMEWEWLYMLESSKSVCLERGWQPIHLTLYENDRLIAAAPLYIKMNSDGEYVYDLDWIQISKRIDISYYPKMVGMTPLTPVPGYRFLIDPDYDEMMTTRIMVNLINFYCKHHNISCCNFLHVDTQWLSVMFFMNFVEWKHYTYQWHNEGYEVFDNFLNIFNANQRKNIKRERKALCNQKIEIKTHVDENIPPVFYSKLSVFYERSMDKFGPAGNKYLTPNFFARIATHYNHRSLFISACPEGHPDDPLALAYFVHKNKMLYGRYWGTDVGIPFLHFNVCYYGGIEWAIQNKIQQFDPGAGGGHKPRRGFPATPVYSLHQFYDSRLHYLLQKNIDKINALEQQEIDLLNANLPFSVIDNN
ncbi:MAG: N-acetyltransferase [Candidatus Magnetomorum sp.]|nr:N-acetyltransferase [Candidatus Magnetomorum sp.]